MDFLNFFGLKEDPFKLTPDPAYFYPSAGHNEGLLLMNYSTDQKEGFVLVTGDPGTGKTTLLRVFLEKWKSKAETAIILTPRLSPEEFLISIAEDLKIDTGNKNKNEIIKALRDFMTGKSRQGKRVIIIVDEAQNLPDDTMEELRLLSNLETDKDKLLQIILLGQPELERKMMTDRLRQLNQRITTRIHLQHFTAEETSDYINYRIIKAGKENLKISKKSGKLTYRLTNGIPRLINMLMSRALMASYLEESSTVLPRHIHHAVKSLNHTDIRLKKWNRLMPVSAVIILILLLGSSVYYILQYKIGEKTKEASVAMQESFKVPAEESVHAAVERPFEIELSTDKSVDNDIVKKDAKEDARGQTEENVEEIELTKREEKGVDASAIETVMEEAAEPGHSDEVNELTDKADPGAGSATELSINNDQLSTGNN